MPSLLDSFGDSTDQNEWQKYSLCSGLLLEYGTDPPEIFHEAYESDVYVRKNVDKMCLACPVIGQCLNYGMSTKAIGVHGGVYLENGKKSEEMNDHKTDGDWQNIMELTGEKFV